MARILLKRSTTTGAVPSAAALLGGEAAVNVADARLFLKNSGGVVKDVVQDAPFTGSRTGAVPLILSKQLDAVFTIRQLGAIGTAVPGNAATDTAAFNKIAAAGGTVWITKGTYYLNAQIAINAPVSVMVEAGVTIYVTHNGAGFHMTAAGPVRFAGFGRPKIIGPRTGAKEYVFGSRAFSFAGSAVAYLPYISIEGFDISEFKEAGVRGSFARDLRVYDNEIYNCTYAGVLGTSLLDYEYEANDVHDIEPGYGGVAPKLNAYGLGATIDSGGDPVSTFGRIRSNSISNVPTWTGIDTHGGADLLVEGNRLNGCRIGMGITLAGTVAPDKITIRGNNVISLGTGGSLKPGPTLSIAGASGGAFARRMVVTGNNLDGGGWWDGTTLDCSVSIQQVMGLSFTGNVISNSNARCLGLFYQILSSQFSGNVFDQCLVATTETPMMVQTQSTTVDVGFDGNHFATDTGVATYAFDIAAQTAGYEFGIGRGNKYRNVTRYHSASVSNRIDLGAVAA